MPYLFKTVVASGTLAAGNAKLSMVDAAAFADSVDINLAQYVDGKAMLYLRNTTGGYEAFALLSAVGSGETLTEKIAAADDRTFASDTGWWSKSTAQVTIADGVCHFTAAANGSSIYNSGSLVMANSLYKTVFTIKNYVGGYAKVRLGGVAGTTGTNRNTNDTFTQYLTVSSSPTNSGVQFLCYDPTTLDIDDASISQVTTPSTSGVTLKNLAGAQSFIYKHVSFNPNAEMLWRVVTDKKIYRIL